MAGRMQCRALGRATAQLSSQETARVHVVRNAASNRRSPARWRQGALPLAVQELAAAAATAHPGIAAGVAVNSTVFAAGFAVLQKGLTLEGIAHSWFLGSTAYSAFGFGGYLLLCLYFLFGTLVTKIKLEQKQKEGIAEARSGRRGAGSVWGSGAAAAACAMLALTTGNLDLWQVGYVASVTSKLSDTVSSEIGKAYGKTTYLVSTLKQVPRGTEGAVSLEGTLAGAGAALAFAAIAVALNLVTVTGATVVTGAAVVANWFESYLGAVVQGKVGWLTNDIVNIIQTVVAALLAVAATVWLG